MRLRTIAFASIAIAGMGAASVATPAHAKAAEKDRHCVTNLSAPNTPTACYDSFTEAIAKATGGRVTDAPDNGRTAMKDHRFLTRLNAMGAEKDGVGAAAPAPITILFEDADFGGDDRVIVRDHDCTDTVNDTDFELSFVGEDWNDEIGSYKAFRNCFLMLFSDINFGGASIPFADTRTDLGVLDDEVSSIRWS